jgi:hypothetical protein
MVARWIPVPKVACSIHVAFIFLSIVSENLHPHQLRYKTNLLHQMSSLCALCRHAGEGRNFPWKSDNAFVKVSSAESNGAFTLIEGFNPFL